MSTRAQISDKVRQFLNDAGYYYSSDDVNNSLQDGYDEVCALSGCIEKITTIPFTVNTVYYDFKALIPDFLALVGIWNRRNKKWMVPCSLRELDRLSEKWETVTGEPYLFTPVNFKYVAVFPAINSVGNVLTNTMYVVYKASADTLSDSTEPQIPIGLQEDILQNYTCMDLNEQAEEWTKAQLFLKQYQEKQTELVHLISKRDSERLIRLGGNF